MTKLEWEYCTEDGWQLCSVQAAKRDKQRKRGKERENESFWSKANMDKIVNRSFECNIRCIRRVCASNAFSSKCFWAAVLCKYINAQLSCKCTLSMESNTNVMRTMPNEWKQWKRISSFCNTNYKLPLLRLQHRIRVKLVKHKKAESNFQEPSLRWCWQSFLN